MLVLTKHVAFTGGFLKSQICVFAQNQGMDEGSGSGCGEMSLLAIAYCLVLSRFYFLVLFVRETGEIVLIYMCEAL